MHRARHTLLLILMVIVSSVLKIHACKISREISSEDMVRQADAIVRASVVEDVVRPQISTRGGVDSKIHFKVLEIIRGNVPSEITLPGYTSEKDDFNNQRVPYKLVRPEGRLGSCFAYSYRAGGEYLLMLKNKEAGAYTVEWYALAPVNEQLHSLNDPWLLWVRKMAQK